MAARPVFRDACLADVPALLELLQSAYRGEASRAGWTTEADLLDGQRTDADLLAGVLADPDGCVLLAQEGEALLASAHVRREGRAAWFGQFAVAPQRQGRGLGSRLLVEAERRARSWGCVHMHMHVIAQRAELIAWYARRGYRLSGVQAPFPYGDERFGIPKRPDLRFERLDKLL